MRRNILATYQDDFAKYSKRLSAEYLDEIFRGTPFMLGNKFKYSAINKQIRFEPLKKALNLLCKARICHKVWSCSANGVPNNIFLA
ncbi:MAG: hypothetical protein JXR42_05885 [Gammaproteobacteria bacterium]|nr:hypothetical protein [Gammaproteobacteria bacterium]